MKSLIKMAGIPILVTCLMFSISCSQAKTVSKIASSKKIIFGMAVAPGDITDPVSAAIVKENYNYLVSANNMKWENIRPNKTFWNWGSINPIIEFAKTNKMKMKYHTFVWHDQNPAYIRTMQTREEAIGYLTEQITTVMEKFKGVFSDYDVANEVLNEDGTMRNSVWYKVLGPDYLDVAFTVARKADPAARLILNDYNNEYMGQAKADGFYNLVKDLVDRKIPIDGVGLQLHLMAKYPVNEEALRANIKRFRELGLFVSFTEIDVRIDEPVTEDKIKMQSDAYLKLMEIALSEPNVDGYIMWGVSDKTSWIPRTFPGYGSAHIFDNDFKPKPVYHALVEMIKNKK